ncbi:hypothetical protein Tco_0212567 [Tanacetum coccineum]
MTGTCRHLLKEAYSRWGGSSLSSTSGGSSTEVSTVLAPQSLSSSSPGIYVMIWEGGVCITVQIAHLRIRMSTLGSEIGSTRMKLDHLLEQEPESASSIERKSLSPKGGDFCGEASRNNSSNMEVGLATCDHV